jgi:hypothetical protein
MHTLEQPWVLISTMSLLFVSISAAGDGVLPITIVNDNPDTILVSAYDMNLHPPAAIMMGQKISGFASIDISNNAVVHVYAKSQ